MKSRKKATGKRLALVILNTVLASVLVILLGVSIYAHWILGRMYRDPSQDVTLSEEQIQEVLQEDMESTRPADLTEVKPEDVDWGQVDKVEAADHIFNVLLVGQDRRPGEIRARSDTMILITINTRDYTITMTSFLRDLYVQIPSYAPNRLNVPYVFGGFDLLADTMEQNFGVRPDRFVEVDFDGFKAVVDGVGGVDVEVTALEAARMNNAFPCCLVEGINHMDGELALNYARNRSIEPDGDFSRTRRQRKVIAAIIEKARHLNLVQINDLLLALTDVIQTDMNSAEIMSYVAQFYPMLSKLSDPINVQIPADEAYYFGWVNGIGSVVVPDLEINNAIIAKTQQ